MLGKYVLTLRKTAVCRGLTLTMPYIISLLSVTCNGFTMNISKVDYITKLISLHLHSLQTCSYSYVTYKVSNTCIPIGMHTRNLGTSLNFLPLPLRPSINGFCWYYLQDLHNPSTPWAAPLQLPWIPLLLDWFIADF